MGLFEEPVKVDRTFQPDGRVVILEDDTLQACRQLPGNTFKLIVSSPPYNIGKRYESQVSLPEYLRWQQGVIGELVRLLHPNGSICWQVGN